MPAFAEVLVGEGNLPNGDVDGARADLAWVDVHPVDERPAIAAGRIADEIAPGGPYVDGPDALIAAVGCEFDAPVVSGNGTSRTRRRSGSSRSRSTDAERKGVGVSIGSGSAFRVGRLIESGRTALETGLEETQRRFGVEISMLVDDLVPNVSLEMGRSEIVVIVVLVPTEAEPVYVPETAVTSPPTAFRFAPRRRR